MKEYLIPTSLSLIGGISGVYLSKGIKAYNQELIRFEEFMNCARSDYARTEKEIEGYPVIKDVRLFFEKGIGYAQGKLGIKQRILNDEGFELTTGMARREIPEFKFNKLPEGNIEYPLLGALILGVYGYQKMLGTIKLGKLNKKINNLENELRR